MTDEIKTQAARVLASRVDVAMTAGILAQARAEFDHDHSVLIGLLATRQLELREREDELRVMAVEAYEATGNKKPGPGVAIREVLKMDYDPIVALDWAKKHDLCLTLDRKNFEDLAKRRAGDLDFVEYRNEAQAIISTDLGKALGLEEGRASRW